MDTVELRGGVFIAGSDCAVWTVCPLLLTAESPGGNAMALTFLHTSLDSTAVTIPETSHHALESMGTSFSLNFICSWLERILPTLLLPFVLLKENTFSFGKLFPASLLHMYRHSKEWNYVHPEKGLGWVHTWRPQEVSSFQSICY